MPATTPTTLSQTYDAALRRFDRPVPPADKSCHDALRRAVDLINLDGVFFTRIAMLDDGAASLYAGKPSWRELVLVTVRDDDLTAAMHNGGDQAVAALVIEELARTKGCAERAAKVRYLCGKTPAGPAFSAA